MVLISCVMFLSFLQLSVSNQIIVEMPPKDTLEDESYVCRSIPFENIERGYLESIQIDVDRSRVHHVATSVCEMPISKEIWECKETQGSNCVGSSAGFGGWDRYTNDKGVFEFPDDLSLELGSQTSMKYLVFQVHYSGKQINQTKPAATLTLNISDKPRKYNFQGYLMGSRGFIPSNSPKGYYSNIACEWKLPGVKAFRYRMHTHHAGYHVEAFLVRNGTWTLLGSGSPQAKAKNWFEIPGGNVNIRRGDILAARCLYINKEKTPIYFGMGDDNEMCLFGIEIGFHDKDKQHFAQELLCETESPTFQFKNFPGLLDYF
ncbi:peptidyl-glycine alpha-amidating monooxygenase-like [Mytilus edulis]|uniref:peptidyl-glycine alpha-amidating monooxygenase-like n=1 Tax=Mytilus edulis TaxID=6550 RepID=UPI0039EFF4AA